MNNEFLLPQNYIAPELPKPTEGVLENEKLRELLEEHRDSMIQLVEMSKSSPYLPEGERGTVGKLGFVVEKRLGKQQPVRIISLTFPDGQIGQVVMRPTHRKFSEYQQQYEVINKYFPKLLLSLPTDDNEEVLFLEKITGLEQKTDEAAWYEHVGHAENFKKTNQDFFQIMDEVLETPLTLNDIQPQDGHNVFLNSKTGEIQLFDVDTLHPSDETHEWKFITCISGMISSNIFESQSNFKLAFQFELLRQYLEKYPDSGFEKVGEPRLYRELVHLKQDEQIKNPEQYLRILQPTDDEYGTVFRQYFSGGTRMWKVMNMGQPLPIIAELQTKSRNKKRLRSDVRDAVENGDFVAFRQALQKDIQIIEEVEERVDNN